MEIYAAAKRERTASLNREVSRVKQNTETDAQPAKTEQFRRGETAISALEAQVREAEDKLRQAVARRAADPEGQASGDELEAMAQYLKIMRRCQEIARRLIVGDRVPPEDEEYLSANDPEGYKLALSMRKPKQNPKVWESVLTDGEELEAAGSTESQAAAESPFQGDGEGDGSVEEDGLSDGGEDGG